MSQRHASSCAGAVLCCGREDTRRGGGREKDEGGGRLHEFNRDRAVHSGLNAVSSSTPLMCFSTGRSSLYEVQIHQELIWVPFDIDSFHRRVFLYLKCCTVTLWTSSQAALRSLISRIQLYKYKPFLMKFIR